MIRGKRPPIWWCSRSPTATLALSRRAGIGRRAAGKLPTLRLCNLTALRHPASVDNYVEQTLTGAKGILIRLIGGENYWPYGIMQVQDFARRNDIALACSRRWARRSALDQHSTLAHRTLRRLSHLCDAGGAVAAQAALAQLSLAAGFYAGPVTGTKDGARLRLL